MPLYFNGSSTASGSGGGSISGTVYSYQGSVLTAGDLPSSGMQPGYVYNIEETGMNVAWTGNEWDALGATVDLSAYMTGTQVEAELAKKVDWKNFEYEGQQRKTIELSNYDSISGLDTKGSGYNLAMVSKWDVADFAAPGLHTNINTKDNVTINDDKIIATTDDIDSALVDTVKYKSYEEGRNTIELANHDSISGLDTNGTGYNLVMLSKWNKADFGATGVTLNLNTMDNVTINDDKVVATVDDIAEAVADVAPWMINIPIRTLQNKVYTQEEIFAWFGVDDIYELKGKIAGNIPGFLRYGISLSTNPHYYKMPIQYIAFETANQIKMVTVGLNTRNDVVSKYEIIINLDGTIIEGTSRNINITLISIENDIETQNQLLGNVNSLLSRMDMLEQRLTDINKTNIEPVSIESTSEPISLTDTTKDYVVTGTLSNNASITGKSVTLNNTIIDNNARLNVKTESGDFDLKSGQINGDFPKTNGNTIVSVNDSEYITVKNTVIDANSYNVMEFGLNSNTLPKSVLIDNCQFTGTQSNNAILVFGMADGGVININNCYFESVSNILRLSNKTNTKCTVNITNCKCDKWESNLDYTGMIICQDYTSKSLEAVQENNLFGDNKITINISNFILPNGQKLTAPTNINSICGSKDANQIIYVYNQYEDVVPYNASRYPNININ